MKKSILSCILVGGLALGLVACGSEESTSTNEVAPTSEVVESAPTSNDNASEVVESIANEIMEVVEDEWPEELAESFKPAFEAHPLFQGRVIVGKEVDEVKSVLGEPSSLDKGIMQYSIENSVGATTTGYFKNSVTNNPDGTYINGPANDYGTHSIAEEYFQSDNDYYTVANDAYMEMQTFVNDVRTSGKAMSENLTYGDVVNAFGTPGYIFKIGTDYGKVEEVGILWVNPEADGETSRTYVFAIFNADGTSSGWFGSESEIEQALR